jgi:Protein of unknown function (DUF3300)
LQPVRAGYFRGQLERVDFVEGQSIFIHAVIQVRTADLGQPNNGAAYMKKLFSILSGLWLLSSCLAPTGSAQSIKPGTEIQVQLLGQLDTGRTQAGEEFSATLAERVRMGSEEAWPRGTQVRGRVVDVVSSGRLKRPASIALQLTQIGDTSIETETEQIDGKSHAGRNVTLIGGGATVGAVLGGIAGGGKGALIGTAIGAGAGTATAAATGKQEIVLPAETSLTFVIAGNDARQSELYRPTTVSYEPAQPQDQYQGPDQDSVSYEPYSPEQLDNLVAPVALYPDPLLAQVLVAATFPDQIQDAAQRVRVSNPNDIDFQPWDVSVKAVAHYPTVLSMLNDRVDWTTALGQAYVYQSTDIMMSVQRLRNLAYSRGNLIATPQQQVIVDRGYIQIIPAQPRVIFVPVYDPGVIYARRVYRPGFGFGGFYNFGTGFVIGAWLNYDLDWHSHRVVYEGWDAHRGGWRERSRPYVHVTNVYVNNRYEHVNVNRHVVDRRVNYDNLRRYDSVHRDVHYENRARIESSRSRNDPPHARQEFRPQPARESANDRGHIQNKHDQPDFRESPRGQHSDNTRFEHANQNTPAVEHPRPQPANERVNDRGDDRSIRKQISARPEQPVRTAPQASPQASSAARPATHSSSENQARSQQRESHQREHGAEKKDKDHGGDKK